MADLMRVIRNLERLSSQVRISQELAIECDNQSITFAERYVKKIENFENDLKQVEASMDDVDYTADNLELYNKVYRSISSFKLIMESLVQERSFIQEQVNNQNEASTRYGSCISGEMSNHNSPPTSPFLPHVNVNEQASHAPNFVPPPLQSYMQQEQTTNMLHANQQYARLSTRQSHQQQAPSNPDVNQMFSNVQPPNYYSSNAPYGNGFKMLNTNQYPYMQPMFTPMMSQPSQPHSTNQSQVPSFNKVSLQKERLPKCDDSTVSWYDFYYIHFRAMVEQNGQMSEAEKMRRLLDCLPDNVKRILQPVYTQTDCTLEHLITHLKYRFEHANRVLNHFKQVIYNSKEVKDELEYNNLETLAIQVNVAAQANLEHAHQASLITEVYRKLPYSITQPFYANYSREQQTLQNLGAYLRFRVTNLEEQMIAIPMEDIKDKWNEQFQQDVPRPTPPIPPPDGLS